LCKQELLSPIAKDNQATSTGGVNPQLWAKLPKAAKIDTRKEAAKEADV
jgi:hypothetical protein